MTPTSTTTFISTATPTWTYTSTPTYTPTSTSTSTPTQSPTKTPTSTFTPSPSMTPANTFTLTPTLKNTFSPTMTPAYTVTPTPLKTSVPTNTPIKSPTPLPTPPVTPTIQLTPTATPIVAHLCTNDFSLNHFETIKFESDLEGLITEDFTNDGHKDVIIALPRSQELVLLEASSDSSNLFLKSNYSIEIETEFIAAGDINGDGNLDLCALSYFDERLVVLLGNETGVFEETVSIEIPFYDVMSNKLLGRNQPIACADSDFDERDEIFAVIEKNGQFNQLMQFKLDANGNELISKEIILHENPFDTIQMINLSDYEAHSGLELAIVSLDTFSVMFYHQESQFSYNINQIFSLEDTLFGNNMTAYETGDVNQDGKEDLLLLPFDGTVRLYTSFNSGAITEERVGDVDFSEVNPIGATLDDAVISDLDKDGIVDLLYVSRGKGVYGVDMISVVCGQQQGEFENTVTFQTNRPKETFSTLRVEQLDLNRDGYDDLVLSDDIAQELVLFINMSRTGVKEWSIY